MAIIKRIASKATPNKIINYLNDKEKTNENLISGKDCTPENAINEFRATKELYGKNDKIQYHHIVQSFSPDDDITPEKAHQLGKELAENQFKGHEVLVVTHTDKSHIHNHLVVNSVSFENGKKYRATNKSLWDIKRESNRLCERENLKTINLEKKATERVTSGELRMFLRGEKPWKDELRECIDFAKERTGSMKEFTSYLKDNFEIETRVTNKTISYKHPEKAKAIRGRRLGTDYDKEGLEHGFIRKEKAITRAGERADTASRAEHEGKDGVRKYSTEREFRDIEERIRAVEQGVKGDSPRNPEKNRRPKDLQRDVEREHEKHIRKPEPRIRVRDFELER